MKIEFCTTFAHESDQIKPFVETWLEYNYGYRLHVFYEGGAQGVSAQSQNLLMMHSLDEDAERTAFMNKYAHMPHANGLVGGGAHFHYDAIKFCHKVFAQSFRVPRCDWWIWLDGDIEFLKPLDKEFFDKVLPDDSLWSVLDRDILPETGFLAWKVGHPIGRSSLDALRRLYTTGEIFSLREWDDCTAFRHIVRDRYGAWSQFLHNICEGVPEAHQTETGSHPWNYTILNDYMNHKKGGSRKRNEVLFSTALGSKAKTADNGGNRDMEGGPGGGLSEGNSSGVPDHTVPL